MPQRLMRRMRMMRMRMMWRSRLLVLTKMRRNRCHPFHYRFHPHYHSRHRCHHCHHRHHCHRCDRFAVRNTPTTMRAARADNRPTPVPAIAADQHRCATAARQRLMSGAKMYRKRPIMGAENRVCERHSISAHKYFFKKDSKKNIAETGLGNLGRKINGGGLRTKFGHC